METIRKPKWEVFWIATYPELESMLKECKQETLISLDTETANWDVKRGGGPHVDYLALIQIGLPRTERTFIVDALAFTGGDRDKEAEAFVGLKDLLEDEDIEFIIQYAPFERRHFQRSNVELANSRVSDTRVMAKKLYPSFRKYGLQDLVANLLDKEISKDMQVSDWTRRPLTQQQIDYAALDPEITYEVYKKIKEDAEEREVDVDNVRWTSKGR
jgi:ribonuclease D